MVNVIDKWFPQFRSQTHLRDVICNVQCGPSSFFKILRFVRNVVLVNIHKVPSCVREVRRHQDAADCGDKTARSKND